MPTSMLAAEKYVALAEEYGLSPTQLALAWAKQRDCNAAIITGSGTVLQGEECVGAFKLELPKELMVAVDVIFEQFRNPSMFYYDKAACMDSKWMGSYARPASQPLKTGYLSWALSFLY